MFLSFICCKGMFFRVCGFRVRVWESYRTSRSFGHGYESVPELPEVPGMWHGRTELTEVPGGYERCCTRTPGIVARGVQDSQTVWVRVCMSYRTNRSSGTGMKVLQNFQKFRVLWHRRTELAEVPGTGMNALQNLQKFRVRVIPG